MKEGRPCQTLASAARMDGKKREEEGRSGREIEETG